MATTTRKARAPSPRKTPPGDLSKQPVSSVEWIRRDLLDANDYNPNRVAPPELRLLERSILADGWTQPLVVRFAEEGRFEIVDGFHRWTVSGYPNVAKLTAGLVPCVLVRSDPVDQRMSTIRAQPGPGQPLRLCHGRHRRRARLLGHR